MSDQPTEPTVEQREAFLAAGNTEAQLAARIRDGIALDHAFTDDAEILLDDAGHGQAWRDHHHADWRALTDPRDLGVFCDDEDGWIL